VDDVVDDDNDDDDEEEEEGTLEEEDDAEDGCDDELEKNSKEIKAASSGFISLNNERSCSFLS